MNPVIRSLGFYPDHFTSPLNVFNKDFVVVAHARIVIGISHLRTGWSHTLELIAFQIWRAQSSSRNW